MQTVFATLFFAVLLVVGFDQYLRWHEHLSACKEERRKDMLLLSSEVCRNGYTRAQLDGTHAGCTEAEAKTRVEPWHCATRRLWENGAVMHVYGLLTDSKPAFMLFAAALAAVVIWGTLRSWTDQRNEMMRLRGLEQLMSRMPWAQQAPAPQLQYVPQPQQQPHARLAWVSDAAPPPRQRTRVTYLDDEEDGYQQQIVYSR